MKKIVSILLAAVLAVTLCISMSATALAAGKVTITASVSPSSLTGAGTVSVKVTVQNNTDSEISDVTVTFPGDDSENIGSIPAGESKTRSDNEWNVSEDMLDTDLTFSAAFTDANGNTQTVRTESLTITKKESTVAATATASVSKDTIEKGDKVKFTFKLKNEGNVTLEKASLKAPPLSDGEQLGKTFSLEPGETKIMTWETPLSESVDVKPVFSYTANGEKGTAKAGTVSVTCLLYTSMGWLDRHDIIGWIRGTVLEKDPGAQVVLHGVSMGAATVMMTTGEQLPENVRAAVEDCGYTDVWEEFTIQLRKVFGLPQFPIMHIANIMAKRRAGYSFREASSVRQVKKSRTPTLFIHGGEDTFVPFFMLDEVYGAAACEKEKLVVSGAQHGESVQLEPQRYWDTVHAFVGKYLN